MTRSLTSTFLLAVGVVASLAPPVAAAPGYDTIFLSGNPAPGTGVNFSYFFFPVINDAGQIAFRGGLTGAGVDDTNDLGMWITDTVSGEIELVARTGDPAPGTGVNFSLFSPERVLNAAGQIAFGQPLSSSTLSSNRAIWTTDAVSGTLELVASIGDPAPGTAPGVNYRHFRFPVFNEAGQIAFNGRLTGAGVDNTNEDGIWITDAVLGTLELVAREGEPAPGTEPGVYFGSLYFPMLNGAGQIAFGGVDNTNKVGIWITDAVSGEIELVARTGDPAPGTDPGVYFASLSQPSGLNGAGQIVFAGIVRGAGVDSPNSGGIWVTDAVSGTPELVVRNGDPAPGTGQNFRGVSSPVLNGAGQIAFYGKVNNTSGDFVIDEGMWVTDAVSGTPELIARSGDPAPGTAPGVYFGNLYGAPVLNGAGQTAFRALVISDEDRVGKDGIWATDRDGLLTPIILQDQLFDVSDDPLNPDLRTVRGISFSQNTFNILTTGNEDGRPSPFNDLGQLVFTAHFTDGSYGLFVSNVVAIPEPSSGLLVAAACGLSLLWRYTGDIAESSPLLLSRRRRRVNFGACN